MLKRSLSILALILAIAFTGYVIFSFWVAEHSTGQSLYQVYSGDVIMGESDTACGGLFRTVQVNDSLPYYKYKPQADSIKNILDKRDRENKGEFMSGMSLGFFGVYSTTSFQQEQQQDQISDHHVAMMNKVQTEAANKRNSTNNKDSIEKIEQQLKDSMTFYENEYERQRMALDKIGPDLHYFGLIGFSLPEKTRFFVQNGTYNLAYLKWDSVSKENHVKYGHYERKQIPVRFSVTDNRINIPVSKSLYIVLNTICIILGFGVLFLMVYLFIGLPLQILINISKGKPFDEENIHRFTIMYRIMLTTVLCYLVMPYILRLVFYKMIPGDFTQPGFWESLWEGKWLLLVTIVLFLIRKAFQKGNSLQREQDLTI